MKVMEVRVPRTQVEQMVTSCPISVKHCWMLLGPEADPFPFSQSSAVTTILNLVYVILVDIFILLILVYVFIACLNFFTFFICTCLEGLHLFLLF